MADLRLFIAAEITDEMRSKLGELIEKLSSPKDGVKWVRPGSIHLTLKFLGSVNEDDLSRMKEAGEKGVSGFKGMDDICLTANGLGTFPGGGRARVIWIGLDGDIGRGQGRFGGCVCEDRLSQGRTGLQTPPDAREGQGEGGQGDDGKSREDERYCLGRY